MPETTRDGKVIVIDALLLSGSEMPASTAIC
jgi:hypothetical protein